ncbi:amidohydrolase family protein [Lysobacter ciconiae]|uniref:Amidohydrolase family protein n=1 Tax=Novilysobacter ciconiae TaxID=2781022 RepID=A0A7S6UI27_9GAMM|nr:amidohydrolase family protein [Lysobacter ciconiae]QOW20723.1 amidohydrolase family protein [Lysobacter ciconiae]
MTSLAAAVLALCAVPATARELLIRNATVHTGASPATLTNTDVLVSGGVIRQIGAALSAPASVRVVDAGERRLTPALFGGITGIGIEEVSGERSTVDSRLGLGAAGMPVRPEFDVTLAYNPDSLLVPVARIEGIGWTLLGAGSDSEGSIIGGQGGVFRLDGSADPIGPKALFVDIGADAAGLSGQSRAAQWMILDQLVDEVRGRIPLDAKVALLTPAGRKSLATYLDNGGRVVVGVDRAADIRQLLRWSAKHKVRIAILGGAEAWKLAPQLAAADVAVFVNPLDTLPAGFDQIGATPENAARLAAAGVAVGFSQSGDGSHNARKIRQAAGNAVAHGLPWDLGVAGLTSVPAKVFGVTDSVGSIAVGKRADLVLWSGDPLEVNAVATQVWFDGKPIQMRSRQTDLRDRYLQPTVPAERGGLPPAYPAAVR